MYKVRKSVASRLRESSSAEELRGSYGRDFKLRKPDPTVHRDLERGWLLPYLLRCDELTWQRWEYWYALASQPDDGEHALPREPIPQIDWCHEGESGTKRVRKLWEHNLSQVAPSWEGWGSSDYIVYLLDWLLFGFGYATEAPREPHGSEGASDRLYQTFDLGPMLLFPYDYLGDICAEMQIGKRAGFYPTPHTLVDLMTRMSLDDGEDHRLSTTCDPCLGTGRMLLLASNHTLCLTGQDINPLMVKSAMVNAFLYAPWMARPIDWVWKLASAKNVEPAIESEIGA